jgi:predicted O-methyltransferase YrrM
MYQKLQSGGFEMNGRFTIRILFFPLFCFLVLQSVAMGAPQEAETTQALDAKVKAFLEGHDWGWGDMNVPASDGKILYDLVIKNNYTKALEIGTSTGHSGIWIAWALSKTGGKLTTIEINESRYQEALANFEQAGLSDYIDARLADAHELVPKLPGPFDFVFSDADKGWYKNYLIAVLPKLEVGGCFTAHNVSERRRRRGGTGEFMDYLLTLPNMETTVDSSGGGVSISYKRSKD